MLAKAIDQQLWALATALIQAGADLEDSDRYGDPALAKAIDADLEDLVEELMAAGARGEAHDRHGQSCAAKVMDREGSMVVSYLRGAAQWKAKKELKATRSAETESRLASESEKEKLRAIAAALAEKLAKARDGLAVKTRSVEREDELAAQNARTSIYQRAGKTMSR